MVIRTMTPQEFKQKMLEIAGCPGLEITPDTDLSNLQITGTYDPEAAHGEADDLMGDLLISLGYQEGVAVFRAMERWYS